MQIIPVLDLKDGKVVHAVRGDRDHYQPIHLSSVLAKSSHITEVVNSLLELFAFSEVYIADLNAIGGNGNHNQVINDLLRHFPEISFWLDNGSELSNLPAKSAHNCRAVIGTESQREPFKTENRDFILSLDYKQGKACGEPAWFQDTRLWPREIIVMTLNRVGSDSGPDFQKLAELSSAHPDKNWVAAGGIRHFDDLVQLNKMGISAVLAATALHGGRLSGEEISAMQSAHRS